MPRQQMIEIQCSRCDRKEYRPAENEPKDVDDAKSYPTFMAHLHLGSKEVHVAFEDLCDPCGRTVASLLKQVGKHIEGVSPDRKAPTAKKAPAMQEQPHNGAAPTPHTAASKKPADARSS